MATGQGAQGQQEIPIRESPYLLNWGTSKNQPRARGHPRVQKYRLVRQDDEEDSDGPVEARLLKYPHRGGAVEVSIRPAVAREY